MGYYKNSAQEQRDGRKIAAQEARVRRLLGGGETAWLIQVESISEAERYELAKDAERLVQYENEIKQWQAETVRLIRAAAAQKSTSLAQSIKANTYKDKYGIIDQLGFSFDRHGVYLHYGAGRGYAGTKGSKWTYRKSLGGVKIDTGIVRHTSPDSLAESKMGTGKRKGYDWFDTIVRSRVPALGDIVAGYFATMVIDDTRIYIEKNSGL